MSIKYSDTPQLVYGRQRPADANWQSRFPPDSQPIETMPKYTSDPVEVFVPSGEAFFSLRDNMGCKKVYYERNEYTGAYEPKLTDEYINQPVRWRYQPKR